MLRWRCLWGPDFFSWSCWTHLHMNWIRTSLFRPEEHAFLPIALVSNAPLPFGILYLSEWSASLFFLVLPPPFLRCTALPLLAYYDGDFQNVFVYLFILACICVNGVGFTEEDEGGREWGVGGGICNAVGFCRCPTGNRWARSLVLILESAGCVMLIGSLRCLCMLQRPLCGLL